MDSSTSYNLKSQIPLFWGKNYALYRGSKISRFLVLKLLKAYIESPGIYKTK